MILAAALLAAAPPVADAERAFAAMAQRQGQWTAFRASAAPAAIMFTPEATDAQAWLKDRADPPRAIRWSPARTITSCDGTLALSTGPWRRPDGSTGTFSTIWRHGRDGWRWLLDSGIRTPAPAFARAPPKLAPDCARPAKSSLGERQQAGNGLHAAIGKEEERLGARAYPGLLARFASPRLLVQRDGRMPALDLAGVPPIRATDCTGGISADATLIWERCATAGSAGAHTLAVWVWRDADRWQLAEYDIAGDPAP